MAEARVEGCREGFNVEVLINPFAIAALKTREAALVVPLETKIPKPVCGLQSSTRKRRWVDVQAPTLFVLAPLQTGQDDFEVPRVDRLYDFGF
jgi:hypothetical protein